VGWLIDTSIWINVERGALSAADVHAITRQEPVYLSPINVAELHFGLHMLPAGPIKQRAAAALKRLRRKPQIRITTETAEIFARLAVALKKKRRDPTPRVNDLWLAAQAVQGGLKLLTANPKDFADIPELTMVALPGARAKRSDRNRG
jgi:predicted nucleic acid-binding protein